MADKQNENEGFFYVDNGVNNSFKNQSNESDFEYVNQELTEKYSIPKKTLIKKWFAAAFLILLITVGFYIISMAAFETFVTSEYTVTFAFFASVVVCAAITAIYIKMREVIRIKDVFMFFLFSTISALSVFMQDKFLYIATVIVSFAVAVIIAFLLNTNAKKVFIPFIAFFLVLNLLTGTERLFMAQDIDFKADYFYFSSQPKEMLSDEYHYCSAEKFSSDDIFDFQFYDSYNSVVKNIEQFQTILDEENKNGKQNKICANFYQTIQQSKTKYDENFFSKYNLLICYCNLAAVPKQLNISSVNINVKNKELKVYGNAEFSSSEYEKIENGTLNAAVCIMFITVEKNQELPNAFEASQISFEPIVI